jgi:DNA replication protein DnaC
LILAIASSSKTAYRIDVLVIDDWAMAPLSEPERRDVWEICEDRYQVRSTNLTSQLPVSRWHEQSGDPTLADGILDRLVHNVEFDGKTTAMVDWSIWSRISFDFSEPGGVFSEYS